LSQYNPTDIAAAKAESSHRCSQVPTYSDSCKRAVDALGKDDLSAQRNGRGGNSTSLLVFAFSQTVYPVGSSQSVEVGAGECASVAFVGGVGAAAALW